MYSFAAAMSNISPGSMPPTWPPPGRSARTQKPAHLAGSFWREYLTIHAPRVSEIFLGICSEPKAPEPERFPSSYAKFLPQALRIIVNKGFLRSTRFRQTLEYRCEFYVYQRIVR